MLLAAEEGERKQLLWLVESVNGGGRTTGERGAADSENPDDAAAESSGNGVELT